MAARFPTSPYSSPEEQKEDQVFETFLNQIDNLVNGFGSPRAQSSPGGASNQCFVPTTQFRTPPRRNLFPSPTGLSPVNSNQSPRGQPPCNISCAGQSSPGADGMGFDFDQSGSPQNFGNPQGQSTPPCASNQGYNPAPQSCGIPIHSGASNQGFNPTGLMTPESFGNPQGQAPCASNQGFNPAFMTPQSFGNPQGQSTPPVASNQGAKPKTVTFSPSPLTFEYPDSSFGDPSFASGMFQFDSSPSIQSQGGPSPVSPSQLGACANPVNPSLVGAAIAPCHYGPSGIRTSPVKMADLVNNFKTPGSTPETSPDCTEKIESTMHAHFKNPYERMEAPSGLHAPKMYPPRIKSPSETQYLKTKRKERSESVEQAEYHGLPVPGDRSAQGDRCHVPQTTFNPNIRDMVYSPMIYLQDIPDPDDVHSPQFTIHKLWDLNQKIAPLIRRMINYEPEQLTLAHSTAREAMNLFLQMSEIFANAMLTIPTEIFAYTRLAHDALEAALKRPDRSVDKLIFLANRLVTLNKVINVMLDAHRDPNAKNVFSFHRSMREARNQPDTPVCARLKQIIERYEEDKKKKWIRDHVMKKDRCHTI